MQLYFIRHGQSTNNALWEINGNNLGRSEDPEISEIGHQQADHLANFLAQSCPEIPSKEGDLQNRAGIHLTHLYTSLMVRSVATGSIIARRLGIPLVAWKDVHEGGGIYLDDPVSGLPVGQPGKNRAYFATRYPELLLPDDLGEDGWWNRPFEPIEERSPRAKRFIEDLLIRHGGSADRVGVVSHGAFYNRMLGELLRMSSREGIWFMINNCAITRIDFNDGEVSLIYTNRADFLPSELIT